ncbi:MAG TPA: hypothetical protein PK413_16070 [Thermoanaerobaculia bacterium]|nr:hypothetical protein [Thermoanaerobaculia bacterium]
MLSYVLAFLAASALVGLYLAVSHLRGNPPKLAAALAHGVLAVIGLAALVKVVIGGGDVGRLPLAIGLFVVAALGGLVLFVLHAKGRPLPRGLIVVHALVAVAGFALVLISALG